MVQGLIGSGDSKFQIVWKKHHSNYVLLVMDNEILNELECRI